MMRTKLIDISNFFLVVFSGFYLTSIFISPIYFTFLLGLVFCIISVNKSYSIKKYDLLFLLSLIVLIVIQSFKNFVPSALVGLILSYLTYILVSINLQNQKDWSREKAFKLIRKFIGFSTILITVETIIRILYPGEPDTIIANNRFELIFYIFKFNSIMFEDSNSTGIFLLLLIGTIQYIRDHESKRYDQILLFYLILILLLTFSRSAIIVGLTLILVFPYRKLIYRFRWFILLFFTATSVTIYGMIKNIQDDSLATKFNLFEETINLIGSLGLGDLLSGVGYGNGASVLSRGTHNYFITHLIEGGILGLTIFLVHWIYIIRISSKMRIGAILFPLAISGLSFISTSIPFVYSTIAVLIYTELNEKSKCTYPRL